MRNEAEDYETSDFIAKMMYLGDHYNTNGNSKDTQRTSLNNDTSIGIDEEKVLGNSMK